MPFKKGDPNINRNGRPKGKTMKEFAREFLLNMSDEEKVKWLKSLGKDIVWRMAEGNPHQTEESKKEITLPKPLLDVLHNSSYTQNSETEEKD